LENSDFRLVIGDDGRTRSLVHKATGQECLAQQAAVPMFTLTQYRPYDNELQLAYPAKVTSFPAQSVQRRGDELIVSFALVGYEATIGLTITDNYIGFTMRNLSTKDSQALPRSRRRRLRRRSFFNSRSARERIWETGST
jgi:hypothetical protein